MSDSFDVVVLGAGPGGYVAAIRAAQLGLSVAVVEHQYWGGVCLNVGCIPSKALLRNAELAHLLTHETETFGISSDTPIRLNYGVAHRRSRTVADGRVRGVHFLMKKNGIEEIDGWGTFTDDHTIEVALSAGGARRISFRNAIIAAGATTRLLPGTQLSERVGTYEEQILAEQLPRSIVVAGAGAIGVEFTYIMNSYGVDVTLVEYADRVLPLEDADVSAELHKRFRRSGVTVMTSTRVDAIEDASGGPVKVTVTKGDQTQVLETDRVLQAVGFAPRVEGYGLENTGVALTDRKAVAIDEGISTGSRACGTPSATTAPASCSTPVTRGRRGRTWSGSSSACGGSPAGWTSSTRTARGTPPARARTGTPTTTRARSTPSSSSPRAARPGAT